MQSDDTTKTQNVCKFFAVYNKLAKQQNANDNDKINLSHADDINAACIFNFNFKILIAAIIVVARCSILFSISIYHFHQVFDNIWI